MFAHILYLMDINVVYMVIINFIPIFLLKKQYTFIIYKNSTQNTYELQYIQIQRYFLF